MSEQADDQSIRNIHLRQSLVIVNTDSSLQSSSQDVFSNAEKTAPPVAVLEQRTHTPIAQEPVSEWKLGRQEALIMMALMMVSLTAALDATVLVPALPVSKPLYHLFCKAVA